MVQLFLSSFLIDERNRYLEFYVDVQFYVGTTIGNTYRFNNVSDFKPHLMTTSHHKSVNGVAFPRLVNGRTLGRLIVENSVINIYLTFPYLIL